MDKDRITGSAKDSAGKVKSAVGDIAGDAKTQASGRAREASDSVHGSRSIAVGGTAIVKAMEKVEAKAKKIASHLLDASEGDIVIENGEFKVAGTDKSIALPMVALAAYTALYGQAKDTARDASATDVYGTLRDSIEGLVHEIAGVEESIQEAFQESQDAELQEIKTEVLRLVSANSLDSPEAHLAYIRGRLKSVA